MRAWVHGVIWRWFSWALSACGGERPWEHPGPYANSAVSVGIHEGVRGREEGAGPPRTSAVDEGINARI